MSKGLSVNWRKIFIWAVAVAMAGGIIAVCMSEITPGQMYQGQGRYSVVILGDSIPGNQYSGEGIAVYLERELGEPVFKGAFGGTGATYDGEAAQAWMVETQLSLTKLAEAIAEKDFSVQRAQIAYGEHYRYTMSETLDYFPGCIEEFGKIDFDQVDYLIIEHGTNDYNRGRKLDNPEDPYDTSTFGGALRYAIETLQGAYPDLELILMTPTWCYVRYGDEVLYCDSTDFGGGYLEDYADLEIRIAEEYEIALLDNYHESGIGPDTEGTYLVDGLHLSGEGEQLLAGRLADLISEIEDNGL